MQGELLPAGPSVIVGLSGGIACYKTATVVSRLVQSGAEVTVAMTPAATQFVGSLTFEALSGNPVLTSLWEQATPGDPQHIRLARNCDLMLIAPCTMDLMAKLAHGFTDDIVSLLASAIDRRTQKVMLAPSMNAVMWEQPVTQRNLAMLREDGYHIVEPGAGWQACRTEGAGRMAEPDALLTAVARALREVTT